MHRFGCFTSLQSRKRLGILCRSKRFNTNAQPSDDEKAAVVGNGMKRFAKRYGVIIFPSVVFTILSIDVINNVSHRRWLDEHLPTFVDFIRTHYGFKDEDYGEVLRMKYMQEFYNRELLAEIHKGGTKLVVTVPSGSTKYEYFALQQNDFSNSSQNYRDLYCSNLVSFRDPETTGSDDCERSNWKPALAVSGCGGMLSGGVENYSWMSASLWDENTGDNGSISVSNSKKDFVGSASNFSSGLSYYKEYGSCMVLPLSMTRDSPHERRQQDAHNKFTNKRLLRQIAEEKIKGLEIEMRELHKERRVGIRDSDFIDQEIDKRQNEIVQLKRANPSAYFSAIKLEKLDEENNGMLP